MYITIGENEIAYNNEFRLFITTKLSNPHYMPDFLIKVTVLIIAYSD